MELVELCISRLAVYLGDLAGRPFERHLKAMSYGSPRMSVPDTSTQDSISAWQGNF